MKFLKLAVGLEGIVMCLLATSAAANTAIFSASVERTLVTADSSFGGCMARLSKIPKDVLPACRDRWVTFSCDGTYTDPVRAYRMLDQAQLALATGLAVRIFADDSKLHDGYCFAYGIDVLYK